MSRLIIRLLDLVIALIAIVVFSPVMLVVAFVVAKTMGRPVIFTQQRMGKDGNLFTLYKFRSMVNRPLKECEQGELVNSYTIKLKDDPRITPFGNFIRKTSLDELPQLWNVIKGDMSIVGPRPFVPEEYDNFPMDWHRRLDALPGITGLAQVSGRSDLPMDDIIRLDRVWVESICPKLYFKVIMQTVRLVVSGKSSY
ncbi:sugar transferase [Paraferrimonas sedimenticola]|uniref:Bacterial sugar transferase domain-containing protein n=1 Tax=Paraferrimonas sedimenticola TaxID=375674 RepID=A0AA37RVW1_9GAMM|nr:sugar transferase [Paraferrimonas sedimenticola]GLP96740.1 hypothetical protein GCM10007895_20460 [Paraferrimonas sedimenticola]